MGSIIFVFLIGCGLGFSLGMFAACMLSFGKAQDAELYGDNDER